MLDYLTSENWRDFRQRYNNTFGWYAGSDKEIPVFIASVDEATVKFIGMDGQEFFAKADKGVPFKFLPFKKRIVVTQQGHLNLVQRVPARQWHRGISNQNTSVVQLQAGRPQRLTVNETTIKNILLGGDHIPVLNGLKINDLFAIQDNFVWLYSTNIGTVVDNKTIILSKAQSIFAQELRDSIRDAKLNYKVA